MIVLAALAQATITILLQFVPSLILAHDFCPFLSRSQCPFLHRPIQIPRTALLLLRERDDDGVLFLFFAFQL